MGLDITYYATVTLIEACTHERLKEIDWDHPLYDSDEATLLCALPEFRAQADGLVDGFYKATGAVGFRAGSYSGYSFWREWLASLIGTTPRSVWRGETAKAFGGLINYSACEGFIGPKTSAKLAADFEEYLPIAIAQPGNPVAADWNLKKYREWLTAFKVAAGGGVVKFH